MAFSIILKNCLHVLHVATFQHTIFSTFGIYIMVAILNSKVTTSLTLIRINKRGVNLAADKKCLQ